jgi:hypothetical protein
MQDRAKTIAILTLARKRSRVSADEGPSGEDGFRFRVLNFDFVIRISDFDSKLVFRKDFDRELSRTVQSMTKVSPATGRGMYMGECHAYRHP